MVYLLNAAAVTGTAQKWTGNNKPGTLQISGTWDGATVTIKGSLDGTNYIAPANSAFIADVVTDFEMSTGYVQAVVSSAGGSTSLTAILEPG